MMGVACKQFVLNKGLTKVEQFYDKFGTLFDGIGFDIEQQKGTPTSVTHSVHPGALHAEGANLHSLGLLRQPIHIGCGHHRDPHESPLVGVVVDSLLPGADLF